MTTASLSCLLYLPFTLLACLSQMPSQVSELKYDNCLIVLSVVPAHHCSVMTVTNAISSMTLAINGCIILYYTIWTVIPVLLSFPSSLSLMQSKVIELKFNTCHIMLYCQSSSYSLVCCTYPSIYPTHGPGPSCLLLGPSQVESFVCVCDCN